MKKRPRRALLGLATALGLAAVAAQAAQPESGKVFAAPGATIYYEVRGGGSGTPLFVANGGPGFDHSSLHVSEVWDRLAQHRPVVFWDQRGNGRSADLKDGQSCTLADQIEDLDALRAHLGYEKIDLLGHSWGGFLAMAYAARHPEQISHLVTVDSAAPRWTDARDLFSDVFPERTERQHALAFAESFGDQKAMEEDTREYLSMLFYSPEKRDALLAVPNRSIEYTPRVYELLNADLARFDLNPELPKFKFPTLVVTGRFDMNVVPVTAYRIHKAIPGSHFVVFEHSGHLPFYEEPERFQQVVEDFLAGR
jgi:proline iminopeptidase